MFRYTALSVLCVGMFVVAIAPEAHAKVPANRACNFDSVGHEGPAGTGRAAQAASTLPMQHSACLVRVGAFVNACSQACDGDATGTCQKVCHSSYKARLINSCAP